MKITDFDPGDFTEEEAAQVAVALGFEVAPVTDAEQQA